MAAPALAAHVPRPFVTSAPMCIIHALELRDEDEGSRVRALSDVLLMLAGVSTWRRRGYCGLVTTKLWLRGVAGKIMKTLQTSRAIFGRGPGPYFVFSEY